MKKILSLMAILTIALFMLTQSAFATGSAASLTPSNPYDLQSLQPQSQPNVVQPAVDSTPEPSSLTKIDEKTSETEKPKSAENELPKAGDASPIFFALAVLAIIATYAYTMYRKRV